MQYAWVWDNYLGTAGAAVGQNPSDGEKKDERGSLLGVASASIAVNAVLLMSVTKPVSSPNGIMNLKNFFDQDAFENYQFTDCEHEPTSPHCQECSMWLRQAGGIFLQEPPVSFKNAPSKWQYLLPLAVWGAILLNAFVQYKIFECLLGIPQGRKQSTVERVDLTLKQRVEDLEGCTREFVTTSRVLSRQVEKLGVRFRVTRRTLRDPIQEVGLHFSISCRTSHTFSSFLLKFFWWDAWGFNSMW